jgi:hypothetical protein
LELMFMLSRHLRDNMISVLHNSEAKLRASKVAVCCFSWGICYDCYGVKTAAGG